jgi:thioredoxin-like negative regulator of GroEL
MGGLKKSPNLKHIIFNQQNSNEQNICPELIEDFNSQGVQCHVIHAATAQEIMVCFILHSSHNPCEKIDP